jgi:hypothetical protein
MPSGLDGNLPLFISISSQLAVAAAMLRLQQEGVA